VTTWDGSVWLNVVKTHVFTTFSQTLCYHGNEINFSIKINFFLVGDHTSWSCKMYSKYYKLLAESLSNFQRETDKSKLQQIFLTSKITQSFGKSSIFVTRSWSRLSLLCNIKLMNGSTSRKHLHDSAKCKT